MSKGLVRGLTLAAFAALGAMTCVASAGADELINSCTTLSTSGATYALASDLTTCGTCLVVTLLIASRLTSEATRFPCPAAWSRCAPAENDATVAEELMPIAGVTDGEAKRQGTTVKNGTITGFEFGVYLGSSEDNVIRNLEVSDNTGFGLLLGARSLVRNCVIERNGLYGILIGDFGQVRRCTISGPVATKATGGSNGIVGGDNVLITNNTVVGNQTGIVVGDSGTVSRNTSSGNSFFGVLAGNGSVVTGNRTNDNGDAGIDTGEGSMVSRNISNGNGGGGNGGGGILAGDSSVVTGNTTNGNWNTGIATVGLHTVSRNISNDNGGGGIDVGRRPFRRHS